jgi:hypothetical protein
MLRSLTKFSTRYFLSIAVIFVFIVVDSFLRFSASFPPREVIVYPSRDSSIDFHILAFNLVLLVLSSPPLLSLLLLRRPSFWRVLLHAACVLYMLVALPLMLNYSPLLLLVVSGAALVAGLPEATAVGRRASGVYYAALLFWLFLVVMFLVYFVTTLLP